jgi:hypothetical protein
VLEIKLETSWTGHSPFAGLHPNPDITRTACSLAGPWSRSWIGLRHCHIPGAQAVKPTRAFQLSKRCDQSEASSAAVGVDGGKGPHVSGKRKPGNGRAFATAARVILGQDDGVVYLGHYLTAGVIDGLNNLVRAGRGNSATLYARSERIVVDQ